MEALASGPQYLLEEGVRRGIPGIAVAIATRNGLAWTGTAGLAETSTRAPVQTNTLFGIGSITKTLVAVVILQLLDEGRLHLEHTPASLLGSAVQDIPNANLATIAQLLNHTSGIPSWEDDPNWKRHGRGAELDPGRRWGKTDTLTYVRGKPALAPPGHCFSYSNTNYTLLGLIIEHLTGHTIVHELRQRIMMPLGLYDFYLEGFEPVPRHRVAHRYHWATSNFRADAGLSPAFQETRPDLLDVSRSNLSVEWTAGGLLATAPELARYGVALRDGRLLSPRSAHFMQQWLPAGDDRWVGHNLFRYKGTGASSIIGHHGDVLGFTASLYWIESQDAVVAVLCNVGAMHAGAVPATAYSLSTQSRFLEAALAVVAARAPTAR